MNKAKNTIQAIYLANSLQQGFIYHVLSQREDDAYRVQILFDYHNQLNIEHYKKAWEHAIQCYPILRTGFNWEEEIIQIIYEKGYLNFTYHDLSKEMLSNEQRDVKIKEIQEEDRRKSFDLTKPTQLRLHLIKHTEEYYTLLKSEHHSISDGWSGPILLNRVHEFYGQLQQGINPEIQEDQSYLKAQKYYQKHSQEISNYWDKQIQEVEQVNDLNPLLSRTVDLDSVKAIEEAKEELIEITGDLYERLKLLAKEQGVTINTVIQFAWHKLIQSYTRDEQTIVGTTLSGRNIPIEGIEDSVGLYINTLPLIINWKKQNETTIADQLVHIHRRITELNNYSYANLAKLQQQGKRLFHSIFVFENYPVPEEKQETKGESKQVKIKLRGYIEKTEYPLGIVAYENNLSLIIKLRYAGEYIEAKKIITLLNQLKLILQQTLDAKNKVSTISLLTKAEYQQIVYDYNKTDQEYPKDKTIHQLFEEQVKKTPNNIAVVFGDKQLTYRELNTKSNQLARYLREQYKSRTQNELRPDTLIALCLDRSLEMIVAILGVLKAGGAYVPIEPSYPEERISYILKDTNTKIVITQEHLYPQIEEIIRQEQEVFEDRKETRKKVITPIAIDSKEMQERLKQLESSDLKQIAKPTALAYVIYTSGTTGKPKGVMINHSGIINRIQWMQNKYPLICTDKVLQKTPYTFDVSVWELLWANWYGATIIIAKSEGHKDSKYLYELITNNYITILHFVPSMLSAYFDYIGNDKSLKLPSIRSLFCSGEALTVSHVDQFNLTKIDKQLGLKARLYNLYGPTEASIDVTYYDCDDKQALIPLGKPIANIQVYILDHNLNPIPIGAIGELYIGGAGLARGYLNQPELTAERFIENPFASEADKAKGYTRLYKTGDLVRWLPDGNLEYIGRNDFQVKIRGYRIELGEIESALLNYPGIKQSVVLAKEHQVAEEGASGNKYLVGYYVAEKKLDEEELLRYLNSKLPEYMVPSILVYLEHLPLTINGKLDRKALPEPEFTNQEHYIAPRNEIESKLCEIWEEVLGLPKGAVGIQDDFFRLGGDSILAIRLVSKLSKEFKTVISVKNIFEQKCVFNLLNTISANQPAVADQNKKYKPFSLVNLENYRDSVKEIDLVEDIYPASYLQKGMLLEASFDQYDTYHDVFGYKIRSKFEESKFLSVFKQLVKRHELLRAGFILNDDHGWSVVIYKDAEINCRVYENNDTEELIAKERTNSFDYSKAGLFRIIINNFDDDSFGFIFSFHHAITDGWSVASLINEFLQLYVYDRPINQLNIHYGEFVKHELLALKDEKAITFWKKYLEDLNGIKVNWKFDTKKTINGLYESSFTLSKKQVRSVHKLAGCLKISVDSIFLLAYLETLSFFINSFDITVGVVVNNRLEEEGGDKLFGLFLNTIPVRFRFTEAKINEKLLKIFNNKLELYKYKLLPYGYIKSLFKQELYDFAFNFVHFHVLNNEVGFVEMIGGYERTNIPFVLNISQFKESLFSINIVVHDNYISEDFLKYFELYYKKSLENILEEQPDKGLCLTQEDYDKIIYKWNITDKKYPDNKTIHQLFEEQVKKTPNNIAVVFEDKQLTYKELNTKSNQLARYLREQYKGRTQNKLRPDTLIALCLDRSLEMIVAILGVLKAGGAYVPIEPSYPGERISYILKDTNTNIVITQEHLYPQIEGIIRQEQEVFEDGKGSGGKAVTPITIDSKKTQERLKQLESSNLKQITKPTALAYVIYTSGTTGKPKGVMVEHESISNLVFNQSNLFELAGTYSKKHCLQFASIAFDACISEVFCSLLYGHTLYISSEDQKKDSNKLNELFTQAKVHIATLPPALLKNFDITSKQLKTLVVAGETPEEVILDRYYERGVQVINAYGPTENTVCASLNVYHKNGARNIGKALSNIKLYVLTYNKKPLPIGAIGELYIGGAGLARGYLNQPELTAERFIENPFASEADKAKGYTRLYKTGDLVRWLPDGNLEYIGRNDFQVKIRGYRIELGEIESALLNYPGIKQSVVLAKEHQVAEEGASGNKYLVGYYVAEKKLDEEELLRYLNSKLPEYMVPSILVYLEHLPLTINGKLDRKALPEPEFTNQEHYIAPRNEIESKLCEIWEEVLGLPKGAVGIQDDFFRIGGDSILSILLNSKMRKSGFNCSVKDIFECRTISGFSKILMNQRSIIEVQAEQGILEGEFGLLPIQEWFFSKVRNKEFSDVNYWNQSFLVKVPELEVDRLEGIIFSLVGHHDILRARYKKDKEGRYTQSYSAQINIPKLKILNITKISNPKKISKILTDWQNGFDIEKGPLWQIGYIHGYEDKSARIYFALHHLIIDAVSWRILIEDIKALYNGEALTSKTTSYRQWINVVNEYAEKNKEEKKYWIDVQKDQQDYSRYIRAKTREDYFELDPRVTKELINRANQAYHTEVNDLLLTALAYALASWSGNSVNHIALEGHGREHIQADIDLTKTIGWFTTIYPVRLAIQETLNKSIKRIKEGLRGIPNKGIGYGIFKYCKQIQYDQSKENTIQILRDLPLISFNYLGQFDSQESLWQITEESSGEGISRSNKDSNVININGMVVDGKLRFSIVSKLGKKEGQGLVDELKKQLKWITKYCIDNIKNKLTENTSSDFDIKINQELLDQLQQDAKKENNLIQNIYYANSLQQGFIYHVLSQREDDAYRVQILFDYHNQLNIEHYKKAWEHAIQCYPILRTGFNWEEEIIQIIYEKGYLNFTYHDLSKEMLSNEQRDVKIKEIQEEDRRKSFDLTKPTQLRLHLIKHTEEYYTLLKSEHHSISDGWSGPILLNRVHEFYGQLQQGINPEIQEDQSYLKAQKYYQKHSQEISNYWDKQIQEVEQVNDLNPLLSRTVDLDSVKAIEEAKEELIEITGDLYERLKLLAKEQGVTINTVIQFAWHKLIQSYTRDEQTIVGTTLSGRNIPIEGIEDSVGLYINTLPLIINWKKQNETTIADQLVHIHRRITELNNYSYANLAKLQQQGKRLFHSIFVFENYPVPEEKQETKGESKQVKIKLRGYIEKTEYPLGIVAYENNLSLIIKLRYAGEYIEAKKIITLLNQLKLILQQTLDAKNKVSTISLLTKAEYQQIVYDYNKTDQEYPKDKTIHQLFEEQVKKTPNNIAVVFGDKQLTYRELNTKSNQLARYLREQYKSRTQNELRPDTLIALCLDRSLEMIVAILGVLKAGGAYVPIEPSYPEERISYILKDTNTKIVITQEHLYPQIEEIIRQEQEVFEDRKETRKKVITPIAIDSKEMQERLKQLESSDLKQIAKPTALAYVIYTSGTTGKPKGVMIEHKEYTFYHSHFVSLYHNFCPTMSMNCVFTMSYCFDASLPTLFAPILTGGLLVVTRDLLNYNPDEYLSIIKNHKINVLRMTPSMWQSIIHYMPHNIYNFLLVLGGEKLEYSSIKTVISNQKIKLINQYGPTECVVGSTNYKINKKFTYQQIIGKVYSGKRLYVLDSSFNPTPVGAIGELYIGGAGLARGYLNQPELTAERFIENPFASEADKAKGYTRLYKTGDLVRWLPDGNLEYIGRNDFQVKIRGYRIELGEIESALLNYPGIKQSVVLAKEHQVAEEGASGNKYLVGYYVAEKKLDEEELLRYLNSKLPEYMVPSILVYLEHLPLTINGKLDRKALPEPEFTNQEHYIAPRNEIESKLCEIWEEVLGLPKGAVGIQDDFFRIGGDSILSILLNSKMRKSGFNCSVKDIFECRTISGFSKILMNQRSIIEVQAEQGILEGEFGLLPIQEWFFSKVRNKEFSDVNYWNQSFLVKVPELEVDRLEGIIFSLVGHHDILRARYKKDKEGRYTQSYSAQINIPKLKILNITKISNPKKISKILTDWQNGFDIEKGPLWQIGYIHGYEDKSARIYFALHHLIIDAVSWRILIEDIKALYNGEALTSKTTSYRQWINVVNEYAEKNKEEKKYWIDVQKDQQDYSRYIRAKTREDYFELDPRVTKELINRANQAYHTEVNDLLLTALAYALASWSGNSVNHIALEGHGREHIQADIDLTKTIGWFTTIYPVRLAIQETLNKSIKRIKEGLRGIPNKGIGYGVLKYYEQIRYDQSQENVMQILRDLPLIKFNYLGQFDSQESLWQITGESSGDSISRSNKDSNVININGMVVDGKLRFSIVSKLGKKESQGLIDELKKQLKWITKHCIGKIENKQIEYTQSDFTDYTPYIVFNADSNAPIFIFPPGNSGAECYFNNLVPLLKNKHLVLFNNFYRYLFNKFGSSAVQHYTYEQLASEYIAIIKKVQPTGPYRLLGWSFGGILAFEIARQLYLNGDKIAKLVMIDSYFGKKSVVKKLTREHALNSITKDINYFYSPRDIFFNEDAVIIMYKATQVLTLYDNAMQQAQAHTSREGLQQFMAVVSYYVNRTKDNCISIVLKNNIVNVIPIKANHENWITNADVLKEIAAECSKNEIKRD